MRGTVRSRPAGRHQHHKPTHASRLSIRHGHAHERGHLDHGGALRCGCDPAELFPSNPQTRHDAAAAVWVPMRRQHIAWQRTHFIYSDRMSDAVVRSYRSMSFPG